MASITQDMREHTRQELELISNMRRRNPHTGLVVFWVKLRNRGYTRSISGLYRALKRHGMQYPGQRIQIDVKYVPATCLVGKAQGEKFYQYTAIDEYSRWRYVEAFDEHNTYTSAVFLEHLLKAFPLPVECVQTDNGSEFMKHFKADPLEDPTLFQRRFAEHGIRHKQIRPYTPRHNGKVERSHRKDNERFYVTHTFYSFEDFSKQLQLYNRRDYNNFPMRPLGWKSPRTVLKEFIQQGVTYV